jgi:hypothetical protein
VTRIPAACMAYDEDLSALLDGELPAGREAELRAHLDVCARCAKRLEELCSVDLALASLPAPAPAGDLHARLAARIAAGTAGEARPRDEALRPPRRARGAPPAPRRRALALGLAAAAAAALLLAVWGALRGGGEVAPGAPLAHSRPQPPTPLAPTPAPEPEPLVAREQAAPPAPAEPALAVAEAGLPELADLAESDVAMLVELETVEDLDVIANLDLLERFLALEERGGAG